MGDFLGINTGNFLSIFFVELAKHLPARITLLSSSKMGEKLRRLLFFEIRFPFCLSDKLKLGMMMLLNQAVQSRASFRNFYG